MSDFEGRVSEMLRAESDAAPDALGLADAARGRARARRRTRLGAVGAGAAALVVAAVGVTAIDLSDDPERPAPATDSASDLDPVAGGRWESWHGVTVLVPDDWQYGNQATWCAGGGSADQFLITRPGGVSEMIACTPGSSYGLAFQGIEMDETDEPFDWPVVAQTGEAWLPHTYVGAHGEDGVLVTVAGPDREAVREVLATVTAIDDVDANGCSPALSRVSAPASGMAVCRYDSGGKLEQSELLTGADAHAAATALASLRLYADLLGCQQASGPVVAMTSKDLRAVVELEGNCPMVTGPGTTGAVSTDVLYWALSPGWSGAANETVPLPDPLRD